MNHNLKNMEELNRLLSNARVGSIINDLRPLTIQKIFEYKDSYLILCNEFDSYIKIEKDSFDKCFADKEHLSAIRR